MRLNRFQKDGCDTSSRFSWVVGSRGIESPIIALKVYILAACRKISLVATDSERISVSMTGWVCDSGLEVEQIIIALNGTPSNDISRSSACI